MNTALDQLAAALAPRYRVDRVLGSGGMAVVYLAEDLKHHRRVAIKVLRGELAASVGADRFLREIEIVARLQHPHILPLLDSGETDGQLFYVMPFVEGRSLRERLVDEQRLPIADVVRLLIEVVDGLSYAHARGVVHRDIKPDNVMLSGRHALLADFGVARAVSAATGQHQMTSAGIALGTPAYMAPEQATADPRCDHRADIYAIGVLAYELLAGKPPFASSSPQQVLAAHVMEAPAPLAAHRADVSPELEHVVMKCLAKRPEDRWQTADELLASLEPLTTPGSGTVATRMRPAARQRTSRGQLVMIALGVGLVAVLASALLRNGTPRGQPLAIGRSTQLTNDDGLEIQPDISPNGETVAYAAGTSVRMRIFIRSVNGGNIVPLSTDSNSVETQPRWSPDGGRLLFLSHEGVRVSPALGGDARVLVASRGGDTVTSAAWSADGKEFAFSRRDSLFRQPVDGNAPRLIGTASELNSCAWSLAGSHIACVSGNAVSVRPSIYFGNMAPTTIVIFPAAGGAGVTLGDTLAVHESPVWSADGKMLFFVSDRQGTRDIYSVVVGADGRARGAATRVTQGLGAHSISLAANGTRLAYAVHVSRANIWTTTIPARTPANAGALVQLTSGNQVIESMRLTRDGQFLVYDSNAPGHSEIYRVPVTGGSSARLTNSGDDKYRPDLSPDGSELTFHSWRTGTRDIVVQPLNGAAPQPVTSSPGQEAGPVWSPNGRALVFLDIASRALSVVHRNASGKWSAPVRRGTSDAGSPDWSPDGKQVAFISDGSIQLAAADTGEARVLYAPAPNSSDPRADQVVWPRDGQTLYFKSHDAAGHATFWALAASGGAPKLLVTLDDLKRPSNRADFATDGKRVYFAVQDRQSDVWVAEIARR